MLGEAGFLVVSPSLGRWEKGPGGEGRARPARRPVPVVSLPPAFGRGQVEAIGDGGNIGVSEQTATCPNCHAPITAHDRFCPQCGEPLAGSPAHSVPAAQETIPFAPRAPTPWTAPEAFPLAAATPLDHANAGDQASPNRFSPPAAAQPTGFNPADAAGSPPTATASPGAPPDSAAWAAAAQPRRGRLAGCVMALVAFLLICAVAAVLAWVAGGRSAVRDRARTELQQVAATRVSQIAPLTVPSGTLTVTAAQINDELRTDPTSYAPLSDPRVTITPDRIALAFHLSGFGLSGLTSTYAGQLAAQQGKLVVVNPTVSGPAGQVLSADDLSTVVENQLNALLDRSGLRATGVQLRDGALTIATAPIAGR